LSRAKSGKVKDELLHLIADKSGDAA
jgi:hypothetical protein